MKQSSKAITLSDVWKSEEVSFKKMELQYGITTCKLLMLGIVTKYVELYKLDMQEKQIKDFVRYILEFYYPYTISDITCFFEKLKTSQLASSWGKPTLLNITSELDQYSIEKQEYAVYKRSKENSSHKADHLECKKFYKMYQNMKKKAKETVLTQKEKDQAAMQRNAEKVKELEMLYPNK